MNSIAHHVDDGEGWKIAAWQTFDEALLDREKRPVVILPGYGMNSFIFSFHPNGLSMEGYLASKGFEVWRADLRGQGDAVRAGGSEDFAIQDLARTDVGALLEFVAKTTRTRADRVTVVGCSLGGTLMFLHAALAKSHRIGAFVAMGSPVKWVAIHPAIRFVARFPSFVGAVPVKGTRRLAEVALPVLAKHTPWVLSAYMNPEIVDTSAARHFAKTVEDPRRTINRQIARWITERDLVVDGVNLSDAVARMTEPVLCVYANGDGIVPKETAIWPYEAAASRDKAVLQVGTETIAMAHADMFVSREAHERVFRPLSNWLAGR